MLSILLSSVLAQAPVASAESPLVITAAECAAQYEIRERNAQTEQGRSTLVRNQQFMIALLMNNKLPVERFSQIGEAYMAKFNAVVVKDDEAAAEFLKAEISRCDGFVKEQAGELVKKGASGG